MKKRVLITGAEGFTGRYMAAEMVSAGFEVHGLARQALAYAGGDVHQWHPVDLLSTDALCQVVTAVQPDFVVNLAAISFVVHGNVEDIYRTNVVGTHHLLQALHKACPTVSAVLLASSANIYGNAEVGTLSEAVPPAPANDYAVSKLAMEHMSRLWQDKLPIIITRPFNYTGGGQSAKFLLPKMVSHFQQGAKRIELGNLDVARDFSDVRVFVSVYRQLLSSPAALGGTFNVCSGQSHTLSDIMRMLSDLTDQSMDIFVNPAFVRSSDVKVLLGSRARLEGVIGPVQDVPLNETLRWMLSFAPKLCDQGMPRT